MLRSEDDPIDIIFYFPVAFSQVYRSGDGSPGSGIVGMRGSPWVGRKSRDNDTFFAYWLPLQFCAFLFSFLIHSKPPIRFLLSLGHSSLFVDPSSSYILGRRLFVQFFSLYNLLSNYHHLLLLYREIALSISFLSFFHMCHLNVYRDVCFQCHRPLLSTHLFSPFSLLFRVHKNC